MRSGFPSPSTATPMQRRWPSSATAPDEVAPNWCTSPSPPVSAGRSSSTAAAGLVLRTVPPWTSDKTTTDVRPDIKGRGHNVERHGYTLVSLPLGLLGLVAAVSLRVVFRGGLTAVDQHSLKDRVWLVRVLSSVSLKQQLLSEQQGVYKGLVPRKVLGASKQTVPGQVDVLVVDDDHRSQVLRHRTPSNKTPPVPEDGGEL